MNNYYAVIMAGGVGSRFWPLSTPERPKQFLDFMGTGDSLLQKTYHRISNFVPEENILILTNEKYEPLVKEQLPQLLDTNLILEPEMRNTAPCLLYAALKIYKSNPKAQFLVAPSDHWIEDEKSFQEDIETCFQASESPGTLCTLGIKPTFAHTGFGYIETDKTDSNLLKKVIQFREKPDSETAEKFIAQGNFSWNAGIFVWSSQTLIEAFKKHQSSLYDLFESGWEALNTPLEKAFLKSEYAKAPSISIDYAILEKSDTILMKEAQFDWSDLGTWESLYEKLPKDPTGRVSLNSSLTAKINLEDFLMVKDARNILDIALEDFSIEAIEGTLYIVPQPK